MTLSFSQKYPEGMGELSGLPNNFVEEIWAGLIDKTDLSISDYEKYYLEYKERFDAEWLSTNYFMVFPKTHTIRKDESDRWKAGNDIHFVINNRTKSRFQFAPIIKCVSVQDIEITYDINKKYVKKNVFVDGKCLSTDEIKQLAQNDGFPSVKAFFQYFNEDFKGKIIHWTNLKY